MTAVKKLDSKESAHLFEIGQQMAKCGLNHDFIATAIELAGRFKGVKGQILLWAEETDPNERNEIIADIQDAIDDFAQSSPPQRALYIKFDDLEEIAKNVVAFKTKLKSLVLKKCGTMENAAIKIGIPQPSLSRFFNTASMPRANTLQKIASALNLSAVEIAAEYTQESIKEKLEPRSDVVAFPIL